MFFIWIHIRPDHFVQTCTSMYIFEYFAWPLLSLQFNLSLWIHNIETQKDVGLEKVAGYGSSLKEEGERYPPFFHVVHLLLCIPLQERRLRGRWSSQYHQVSACLCHSVFCFQMSCWAVSLLIWSAVREQWLMVEIRIETSLVGYKHSIFSLIFVLLSVYFCVFQHSPTLSHFLSFFVLRYFSHPHPSIPFLLKKTLTHISFTNTNIYFKFTLFQVTKTWWST